jgi:hypothetical protein
MTNLEQFLNKETKVKHKRVEPSSGSFTCQNQDCKEIMFEGFVDKDENRLYWICSNNHESSVVF